MCDIWDTNLIKENDHWLWCLRFWVPGEMKLNLMTFWGLFTVWEGQSGPGRAAGNHTTVRSEESRYMAHLRLQRSIIITSFQIADSDNSSTITSWHLRWGKCQGQYAGRCKEEWRIKDWSQNCLYSCGLVFRLSHGACQSKGS